MDGDFGPSQPAPARGGRLDSWKEIAAYLRRDIRTVQRWEKMANLPIRRLQTPGLRSVFAYTADLDEWLAQPLPPAGQEGELNSRSAEKPRRRFWIYAALAAAIFLGIFFAIARRTPPALGPFTTRPITSEPGAERDPDISPDGKYIVYSAETPDLQSRIQVRMIDGGEPRALTSADTTEWSPVWSPNGEQIAFLRGDPGGRTKLVLISPLGGQERILGEVRPFPRRRPLLIGHFLAWTPDGQHLVVPDRTREEKGGLLLIDIDTGMRTMLSDPPEGEFDVEPSMSSDGRLLLFNRVRAQTLSDVYVQRLDATFAPVGPPRKLAPVGNWNGTPRLLEKRKEVLVCAGTVPRLAIWRVPLEGSGKPVSLGIFGDNAVQTAVHAASGRIVSRTFRIEFDILRFPLARTPGPRPEEPPIQEFLQSTFVDRSAAYSPDGSQIAFISDRTGQRHLWIASGSGDRPTDWTPGVEVDIPTPAWSHDSSKIVFVAAGSDGVNQLFVADRSTHTVTQLTNGALDYAGVAWSHDDTALYASAQSKGIYSLYRLAATGGAAEMVSPGYAFIIGAEPSGKGLYVVRRVNRDQAGLVYLPLPTGAPVALADMNFAEDAWVTPDGIYYMQKRQDKPLAPVTIFFRTHSGVVKMLHEYASPPGRGLSVATDGRLAVTTRVVPPISDLLLLQPPR